MALRFVQSDCTIRFVALRFVLSDCSVRFVALRFVLSDCSIRLVALRFVLSDCPVRFVALRFVLRDCSARFVALRFVLRNFSLWANTQNFFSRADARENLMYLSLSKLSSYPKVFYLGKLLREFPLLVRKLFLKRRHSSKVIYSFNFKLILLLRARGLVHVSGTMFM